MDVSQFDKISRFFAGRRRALAEGGGRPVSAGIPIAAQAATPEPDAAHGPEMLFLQSFQSGSITAKEGDEGRYTVTLEHGLGQTIYFSDRPDRIVGTSPTPQFLEGLGFSDDNPPNAALVVETAAGESVVAVVELFNPIYDPTVPTVTYEAAVLADWQNSAELGFTAAPADLAALAPSFGAAHLFIDDCRDGDILCQSDVTSRIVGTIPGSEFDNYCYSWGAWQCLPCLPWISSRYSAYEYWGQVCNERFATCDGQCEAQNV